MESQSQNVISIAYNQIPGIGILQTVGFSIMGAALAIYMVIELYKLLTVGRCDFITPIIKIAGAMAILYALVPIGTFLSAAMQTVTTTLLNQNVFVLASDAWAAAFEGVSGPLDFIKNLFSQITWLSLMTWFCLVSVIIIKLIVLDVLFPILLAVVVVTGSLSIPIGVFPGANTFKGWVLNLVEVSIWPLVFQILATLLFATFATQLGDINTESMTQLRQMYNQSQPDNWVEEAKLQADGESRARVEKLEDEVFYKFVKFLAIAATFGLLCLFTPLLARMIVRSDSAGVIGGIVTAASTTMLVRMTTMVSRRFSKAAGHLGRVAYKSPVAAKIKSLVSAGKDPAREMNERKSPKVA